MRLILVIVCLFGSKAFASNCPDLNKKYQCKNFEGNFVLDLEVKKIDRGNYSSYSISENGKPVIEYKINDSWVSSDAESKVFLYRGTCSNSGSFEISFIKPGSSSRNHSTEKLYVQKINNGISITTTITEYFENDDYSSTHTLKCNSI